MAKNETPKKIVTKKHLARKQREERQTRLILIIAIVIGALIVGLVGYGLVDQLLIRPAKTVAKVGEEKITVSEFESQVQYARVQMIYQLQTYYQYYQIFGSDYGSSYLSAAQSLAYQLASTETLGGGILDDMINDILVREAAAEYGVTVSKEEVDDAVYAAFGFYPNGTPSPTLTATTLATPTYSNDILTLVPSTSTPTATEPPTETPEVTATSSEEAGSTNGEAAGGDTAVAETPTPEESPTITLTPTITSTPTPFTTEIYAQDVENFNDNFKLYDYSYEDLWKIYETDLLRQKMTDLITADLVPFHEEVWARHILVETEEEALDIIQQLKDGGDWNQLAMKNSLDDTNKDNGGDLGWFSYDMMVEDFAAAAFSLEPGQISDPVETYYGYHIIQLVGKREVQTSVADFQTEKSNAFDAWLAERRDARDDIEIAEDWADYVPDTPALPSNYSSLLLGY
ncbi:MAG: peptidylprolyl isomerase [Anaerolineaceae bacterium]|jgi:parvulin-like peptidyl-prolyl isomerase|nr:peptidylprolyl isomerase [Anaerolineaceae bacterium]